jgi:hypothetical protein
MGPWLRDVLLHVLEQQLAGQGKLLDPPCASLTFYLIKFSWPQARATRRQALDTGVCAEATKNRAHIGLSYALCCFSWNLMLGSPILHHPRQFEGGLFVDGWPMYNCSEDTMVVQDGNL